MCCLHRFGGVGTEGTTLTRDGVLSTSDACAEVLALGQVMTLLSKEPALYTNPQRKRCVSPVYNAVSGLPGMPRRGSSAAQRRV